MVSNVTLLQIHQCLQEIFCSSGSQFFGGISVIAVGDLYQLTPIQSKPVFENYERYFEYLPPMACVSND